MISDITMLSRSCSLAVFVLFCLAAEHSALATYTTTAKPTVRNNQPTTPTPTQPAARTTVNPWITMCPNLNTDLMAKGKVSVKELNTVFVPAMTEYVKTVAKVGTEMAAIKIPKNFSNADEMNTFWSKFNASDAKITEGRRKWVCNAMEVLTRVDWNGGKVDGAATSTSGAARFNATYVYNCTQIRNTALKYLRANATATIIAEAAAAMQRAYEDDSKCLQGAFEGFGTQFGKFKFDNMTAADVRKAIADIKLLGEPTNAPNPVGVTFRLAYTAAQAMADLMGLPG